MTADELIAKLHEVPPYTPVEIFDFEHDGTVRAMHLRPPIESTVEMVVLTNDSTYPGVEL